MTANELFLPILIPAVAGVVALFLTKKLGRTCEYFTFLITAVNLLLAILLFGKQLDFSAVWGGMFTFSLKLYHFSSFILLASAGFGFLVALFSLAFMRGKAANNQFYSYFLFTIALANGAVLAENLFVLLFFWEGLLLTLFGMIVIGHKGAFKTAVKAFTIAGVTDLCMMLGIGLTIHLAGTASMSQIHLPLTTGLGAAAFILLMIGAISKGGSMPFHSWIPDAAVDAPLPFMALVPASIEKLLGIYLLSRISLDLFQLSHDSWVSTLMMIVGAVTILLAVLMALIQKDYKRLLSFHAISQVGYMILGIGTAVPAGIVGGIFHMINHALYKSCLFLTGGSVEKQAGTTDLRKLGGLASKMPITFAGFVIAACAISGVPPFNGFFSKELVYDGALERGWIFYGAAVLGSFFTAASFLKLGHAAYFGKRSGELDGVKEAPLSMLIPIVTIAGICVLFGVYNPLPLNHLIQPILGARLEGHSFAGFHINPFLVGMTLAVLAAALIHHWIGVRRSGSGLGAADHIHHAPIANTLYDAAEKGHLDPYHWGLGITGVLARISYGIDRGIDFFYNSIIVQVTSGCTTVIRAVHTGSHVMYVAWSFFGLVAVLLYFLGGN